MDEEVALINEDSHSDTYLSKKLNYTIKCGWCFIFTLSCLMVVYYTIILVSKK